MKVEYFIEHELGFLGCRVLEVHPEEQVRVAQEGGHQEPINVPGVQPALGGEGEGADHGKLKQPARSFCFCRRFFTASATPSANASASSSPSSPAFPMRRTSSGSE